MGGDTRRRRSPHMLIFHMVWAARVLQPSMLSQDGAHLLHMLHSGGRDEELRNISELNARWCCAARWPAGCSSR
jgi:hypothetical protein